MFPLKAMEESSLNPITDTYKILSPEDVKNYRQIYNLQEKERWAEADKVIKRIDNKILMGYVLKQRYLTSATWKTKKKEAENWLKNYADHPFAGKMYDLGKKKAHSIILNDRKILIIFLPVHAVLMWRQILRILLTTAPLII